jgi:hypothetical protein
MNSISHAWMLAFSSRKRLRLKYALASSVILFLVSSTGLADPFTPEQKNFLRKQLEEQTVSTEGWARFNEQWDVTFKVALLMLGILSAVGAAIAGTVLKESPPAWLTIGNITIGAVITGMTASAFSTLNFPARGQLYRKKETALSSMLMQIQYSDPDKVDFLPTLAEIYSWHDSTPPDVQIPPKALSSSNPVKSIGSQQ